MAQPVPATAVPGPVSATVPVVQAVPIKYGVDGDFSALENVNMIGFRQGNVFWEFVAGGCAANTYMVVDRSKDEAILLGEEESDCCCRCCCAPAQPALVKFYNATYAGMSPSACCNNFPPKKMYTKDAGEASIAVMTVEKPGCGQNYAQCGQTNCWVCMECCRSEAWVHKGAVHSEPAHIPCCGTEIKNYKFPQGEPGLANKATAIGHVKVPLGGGGCTPTVEIMETVNGTDQAPFAVMEGPTCFGGLLDLCCPTYWALSKAPGKAADVGMIIKKAPEGGMGFCIQMCTPVDTYDIDFKPEAGLTADQKAILLGELIHLDFLFFESEQPLCHRDDASKTWHLLLCVCYCYGCLCPCELVIPEKNDGG